MPVCEISYPVGLLSENEKSRIIDRVSKLLLEAEGLPDNPVSRSVCLVNVMEAPSVYVGGRRSEQGKILIKIFAFEEAYPDNGREKLYAGLTDIFREEHQLTRELSGNNIWCLIAPITGGNFGVGGRPISLDVTKKIVASYKP